MRNYFLSTQKLSLAVICLLACALSFSSCKKYDDEWIKIKSDDFEKRIAALESWQTTVNAEIISLQGLVRSINENDFVTKVTPLEDGTGYVISFKKGGDITIKHGEKGAQGDKGDKGEQGEKGEKGDMPVIGTKQDTDGIYYWTMGGEWILDGDKKMPVTGEKGADAIAPRIRIDEDTLEWEISTDGGVTYTPTGIVAKGDKGDSMFSALDNSNEKYVELTLADGETKIQLPRYAEFAISFEIAEDETFYASPANNELALVLPSTLREEDYRSIIAAVTPVKGDNVFVKSGSDWNVEITAPEFDENGNVVDGSAKLAVTGCSDSRLSDTYMLRVALVSADGKEATATRMIKYFDGVIAESTEEITDNNVARLAWKGEITEEDFTVINALRQLEVLDLTMAEATAVPKKGLKNSTLRKVWLGPSFETLNEEAFSFNSVLEEIDLPNVKTIEKWAFYGCTSLRKIDLPNVQTLGEYVFNGSTALTTITLHEGLTTLSVGTFLGCGIATLEIPKTVTEIPERCFQDCKNLQQVYLHDGITYIGNSAFLYDRALERFIAPRNLTLISEDMFHACYNLNYVLLHNNITEIESNAFYYCTSLSNIINMDSTTDFHHDDFPSQLQTIGSNAFEGSGLKFVGLRRTMLQDIADRAFYDCKELESIELPESLTKIESYAFNGCSKISDIRCYAATTPELGAQAFNSDTKKNASLICPNGDPDEYKRKWAWEGYVRK